MAPNATHEIRKLGSTSVTNNVAKIATAIGIVPFVLIGALWVTQAQGQGTQGGTSARQAYITEHYDKLPLAFEANQGQFDGRVKFHSRGTGYDLSLTASEAVLEVGSPARLQRDPGQQESHPPQVAKPSAFHIKLVKADTSARVSGEDQLIGKSNYFIGNDPRNWHTGVSQYAKVRYSNIYPGIDVIYYGKQRQLEYDFVLRPGASPRMIRLAIGGAGKLRLEHGDLVFTGSAGEVKLRSPSTYQLVDGNKVQIDSSYVVNRNNEIGFRVAPYDRNRELIIDPVLLYSTYLGGSGEDRIIAITTDTAGNSYVTGWTTSSDFPTASGIQPTFHGTLDAFVSKINSDGTALIYSTYLGGSWDEAGQSIALDSGGNVYLTGYTGSGDFPTVNPFQPTLHGGRNAFVTKINAAGNALIYSTYLGGGSVDYGWGIAVDSAGRAHVRGDTASPDFPVLNAIQPNKRPTANFNNFVTEFTPAGNSLVYSTYWGGSVGEGGEGIAVDSAGNTLLEGYTASPDFPTVNPIQPNLSGAFDAFFTKFSADGQSVLYSTFLGGSKDDWVTGSTTDSSGNAYVVGYTTSSNFPTANAIQPNYGGNVDAFVAKINAAGNALVYSTYLGGSADDHGGGIAADAAGNAYVVGYTSSTNFPTVDAIQASKHGGRDAFVTKLNAEGSAILYSTYLGGSSDEGETPSGNIAYVNVATDPAGDAYVTGVTFSDDFPVTPGTFQQSFKGVTDSFVAKITSADTRSSTTTILTSGLNPSVYGQPVTFTAEVTSDSGTPTGTVQILNATAIVGSGMLTNGSASVQVSTLPGGSNSVTASYLGDSSFASSKSAPLTQTVTPATTTTALTSSRNPAATNESFTFTAIITSQSGGTVTGSVTFFTGSQALGSAPLSGNRASLTTSFATAGTYSISAQYTSDANNSGSTSATLEQTIIASTTTTLISSLNPSSMGQAVTFTATVTSSAGTPPNGESITFYDGHTVLGTAPLSGGAAAITTSSLSAAIHTISASYSGDSRLSASTSPDFRQVVNSTTKSATSTVLTSDLDPSIYGQKVNLTAMVTTAGALPPTGNVVFTWSDGFRTFAIGSATLDSNGVAILTKSNLNADRYPLIAMYKGDANNLGSSSPLLNLLVLQATSRATLTSSVNPSAVGQPVTFTAKITSPTVRPTGPVIFTSGKTALGTAQLNNGNAVLTISSLAAGSWKVTATYAGNSNVAKSSASVTQVVQ